MNESLREQTCILLETMINREVRSLVCSVGEFLYIPKNSVAFSDEEAEEILAFDFIDIINFIQGVNIGVDDYQSMLFKQVAAVDSRTAIVAFVVLEECILVSSAPTIDRAEYDLMREAVDCFTDNRSSSANIFKDLISSFSGVNSDETGIEEDTTEDPEEEVDNH